MILFLKTGNTLVFPGHFENLYFFFVKKHFLKKTLIQDLMWLDFLDLKLGNLLIDAMANLIYIDVEYDWCIVDLLFNTIALKGKNVI